MIAAEEDRIAWEEYARAVEQYRAVYNRLTLTLPTPSIEPAKSIADIELRGR
jgi:hypothetical protein